MSRRKRGNPLSPMNALPSTERYEVKAIYTTLHLPKDVRTDAQKECNTFRIFANDLHAWGLDDAIGYWCSMTEKPLPVHPGDCVECRKDPGFTLASPKELDERLKKAAEAVAFMRKPGVCTHQRKNSDGTSCTICWNTLV